MRTTFTLLVSACIAAGCASVPHDGDGDAMGPRGGVLQSEDGRLQVEIRDGALEDSMGLSVVAVECENPADVACYEFEPWGVMLAAPASVVFDYTGGMPSDPQAPPMLPDELTLHVEGAQGWDAMPDAAYDADEGVVWASCLYLTSVRVAFE